VDEILYPEIARRRAQPDLGERTDVFSALLLATDEHGEPLGDSEVRDELVTLLLAGHETTATGLAWTFDQLLHAPRALATAQPGDDQYLDAVVKEALRIRPVIAGVGRVVRGEPFALNGYEIPPGSRSTPRSARFTAGPTSTRTPARFAPSDSLQKRRPTPTPGCRSAAARAAVWGRASR
jgi:cytochrome P450 family 135